MNQVPWETWNSVLNRQVTAGGLHIRGELYTVFRNNWEGLFLGRKDRNKKIKTWVGKGKFTSGSDKCTVADEKPCEWWCWEVTWEKQVGTKL